MHDTPIPHGEQSEETISIPSISFPKGGGHIQGMGEKFSINPVTGTGSFSIPVAATQGRNGFGPTPVLTYNSGAGNGPFGLGWSLPLPAITRKTEKGLPCYNDADESDTFILSDTEDLVPVLVEEVSEELGNSWILENLPERVIGSDSYRVKRYRPRIEGLWSQIEWWTNRRTHESHWRTISRDNVVNIFGKTSNSRIEDPEAPADAPRVFSWLICESYDDRGNCIYYKYKEEDASRVNPEDVHECGRNDSSRTADRYLKQVFYGNRTPIPRNSELPREFRSDLMARNDWLFELLFDYGEGHYVVASRDPEGHQLVDVFNHADSQWLKREDPFSRYRPGFEVRTYRLCHRILMFHHFPDELETEDYLVKSTEFEYDHNPYVTSLTKVIQSGYKISQGNTYRKKSFPPVEFEYSKAVIQKNLECVDGKSIENITGGIDEGSHHWVDLDGEGTSGILTELEGTWYYKRNISPLPAGTSDDELTVKARFAEIECLPAVPSVSNPPLSGRRLMDLAGNGQLDVVEFESSAAGYFQRSRQFGWKSFREFKQLPRINWQDPNIRFIDLTGDGLFDVLLTEDDVYIWYQSEGEAGYSSGKRLHQITAENKAPKLLLADRSQAVYLADFSGDGLTDIVRIRNGEVCYWPNLGYARFGARVTMDNAPFFDRPDRFEQNRIRLADVDGSGVVDILYLQSDRVCIYKNQSGNNWSGGDYVSSLPPIDDLSLVTVKDLLGNGTACLVWSSLHSETSRSPIGYVDLMGGQKPHLLIAAKNNLGAETRISYSPSTKFYLQDQRDGNPWITRIPFPVHCVEEVTVTEKWRKTEFTTHYSYHHGYYDPLEREFRGFARVEKVDVENYGRFQKSNINSPYISDDETLYQPPVKTITWFHTGVYFDRQQIYDQFTREFFPNWLPEAGLSLGEELGFTEKVLPNPDLSTYNLTENEWREAFRACKGRVLREEVYELDLNGLEQGRHERTKLFSTSSSSFHIRLLQPKRTNSHGVFSTIDSESLTYHYQLDLEPVHPLRPDPRVGHCLVLDSDEYGQPLQQVAIGYPRFHELACEPDDLPGNAQDLINGEQAELHIGYTQMRYTNDAVVEDNYRLRLPCEISTYEVTGVAPSDFYFTPGGLRSLYLDETEQIDYHHLPGDSTLQKRIVERVQHLFFGPDLQSHLPLGELNFLALPYESYRFALTDGLVDTLLGEKIETLSEAEESYQETRERVLLEGGYCNRLGGWWIRTGIAGFADDAMDRFYLPERYTNQFGQVTEVNFDPLDLYVQVVSDPMQNITTIEEFDFRLMTPARIKDLNDNISVTVYDILGMPVGTAIMGKEGNGSGDTLENFTADISASDIYDFFNESEYDEDRAGEWLSDATSRFVYSFGEQLLTEGTVKYGHHPPCACSIMRELHVNQVGGERSPLQVSFGYSDGLGQILVTKGQAEPESADGEMRWLASGKTVFNNKGKPVKQYEPYFCENSFLYEDVAEIGVASIFYYNSFGQIIRTEKPDGSYSRIETSPWSLRKYDANDTVLEPGNTWYEKNSAETAPQTMQRAARLSAVHANTPGVVFFDSLGREAVQVAHNRWQYSGDTIGEEKCISYTKLDTEGNPLWIRDGRNNLVMQYISPPVETNSAVDPEFGYFPCYDIAGNLLFQHSMESGSRWMLSDIAGNPMYGWDSRGNILHTEYDALRRSKSVQLRNVAHQNWIVIGGNRYGDDTALTPAQQAAMRQNNLRGAACRTWDQSGEIVQKKLDWSNNVQWTIRRIARQYEIDVNWEEALLVGPDAELSDQFMDETFHQISECDALGRITRQYLWHRGLGSRVSVSESAYNKRNLLDRKEVVVNAVKTEDGHSGGDRLQVVRRLVYNETGQRLAIDYGNDTSTNYSYDENTFKLTQMQTTRLIDGKNLQDLYYTYDPVGNITSVINNAQPTVFYNNASIDPHSDFTYDAFYRLIEARGREHAGQVGHGDYDNWDDENFRFMHNHPHDNQAWRNYTQRYRYDSAGNILELQHLAQAGTARNWNRKYQYGVGNNRLLATGTDNGDIDHYTEDPNLGFRYRYNEHGSISSMPHLGIMEWNYNEQLRYIARTAGSVGMEDEHPDVSLRAWYRYDAAKKRTRKRVMKQNGVVEERLYLGGVEIFRKFNNRGSLLLERETIRLRDESGHVVLIDTKTADDGDSVESLTPLVRYQLATHLGSTEIELDEEAQVISYEEYHPFGSTSYQAHSRRLAANYKRYRYTARERDEETGLSCHTARYYVNWLARWASSDPAGLSDGYNLYRYSRNNPVRYCDPMGTYPPGESEGVDPEEALAEPDPDAALRELARVVEVDMNPEVESARFFGEPVVEYEFPVEVVPPVRRRRQVTLTETERTELRRDARVAAAIAGTIEFPVFALSMGTFSPTQDIGEHYGDILGSQSPIEGTGELVEGEVSIISNITGMVTTVFGRLFSGFSLLRRAPARAPALPSPRRGPPAPTGSSPPAVASSGDAAIDAVMPLGPVPIRHGQTIRPMVNPGYPNTPGSCVNCLSSAMAYDLNMSGAAGPGMTYIARTGWVGELSTSAQPFRAMPTSAIQSAIQRAGPGARGIVWVEWSGGASSHAVHVSNVGGAVNWIDPQTGRTFSVELGNIARSYLWRTN